MEAISEVSSCFVDMEELSDKAGAYLAKLVGSESSYITNGAAAGIVFSVAASITNGSISDILRLPESDGMPSEIVVQKSQVRSNPYISLVRIAGGKLKVVDDEAGISVEKFEQSITTSTAAVLYVVFDPDNSALPLKDVISIAHKRNIPVIVDAAAELPPSENLRKYTDLGADLVAFSGGKDLGALNNTGVIFGKAHLIENCKKLGPLSYPLFGGTSFSTIGRPMKVSKEGIVALVAAIEKYLDTDHEARIARWESMCSRIVSGIARAITLSEIKIVHPSGKERIRPIIVPRVELKVKNASPDKLLSNLRNLSPPIYVNRSGEGIVINPQCLLDDEVEPLIKGIVTVLENFGS